MFNKMANFQRSARMKIKKKINLLRRRRLGSEKVDDGSLIWFIAKRQNGKTFYIADYDDKNNTVLWTANKKDGISFRTERAVHTFIHNHLKDRADIFLIQAPRA